MRTSKLELNGKEYLLASPMIALQRIGEACGGLENLEETLSNGKLEDILDKTVQILHILMESGTKFHSLSTGEQTEKIPSKEELGYMIEIDDVPKIVSAIHQTIIGSTQRKIELEKTGDVNQGE